MLHYTNFQMPVGTPPVVPPIPGLRPRHGKADLPRRPGKRSSRQDRAKRFTRLVDQFERDEIEAAVDALIVMLDERDGDPDVEANGDERDIAWPNGAQNAFHTGVNEDDEHDERDLPRIITEDDELAGDETDGNYAEDDFAVHAADGPGCPIADAGGGAADDQRGDPTYAEWHTLDASRRRSGAIEGKSLRGCEPIHEDVEDDDRDSCLAADDDPKRTVSDGFPGDGADAEENGDHELNGDEGDHTPGAPWE